MLIGYGFLISEDDVCLVSPCDFIFVLGQRGDGAWLSQEPVQELKIEKPEAEFLHA